MSWEPCRSAAVDARGSARRREQAAKRLLLRSHQVEIQFKVRKPVLSRSSVSHLSGLATSIQGFGPT